ncbi:aminoacyl-tRNA hydrolase [bacterium]|nr:aminoacyl-tRNA hydrolase [bacterium]
MNKFLLVGLGNPGEKYKNTRHNIGFEVLDFIAHKNNLTFKSGRGNYHETSFILETDKIILAKPQTFMNLSGVAVRSLVDFYQIELKNILVLCDDVNIPLGKLRIRAKGSSGGNNGLASIIDSLGTNQFARLRIGVGNDFQPSNLVSFVLGKFPESQTEKINSIKNAVYEAALTFCKSNLMLVMNKFNSLELI